MSTIRNANIATIVAQYTHEYRTPYRPKIAFLSTRLLMKRLSASRPSRSTAVRSCQQLGPRGTGRSWAVSGPYRARYARTTGLWSTSSYDGYGRRRTRNPLQTGRPNYGVGGSSLPVGSPDKPRVQGACWSG